ncbi:MAG: hypothetical protein FJ318_06985 [SAR202 cluster bacterium]|nr:hypothetical protein [SAR202 cluster bacterium]
MLLRACPKCGGDMFEREVASGPAASYGFVEVVCIQCGYRPPEATRERAAPRFPAKRRNDDAA